MRLFVGFCVANGTVCQDLLRPMGLGFAAEAINQTRSADEGTFFKQAWNIRTSTPHYLLQQTTEYSREVPYGIFIILSFVGFCLQPMGLLFVGFCLQSNGTVCRDLP